MAEEKWEVAVPAFQKANKSQLQKVCDVVAESICRDGSVSSDQFSSIWSIEEWWQVRAVLTEVFKRAVGNGWSKEQISEHLGSLKDEYKKCIADSVSVHSTFLRQKLLTETASVSKSSLADFDWKLKLALSSDKLATLQEPFLQVDFDVLDANGERKDVCLELSKTELSKLISSLEACSKSVQQLTTS